MHLFNCKPSVAAPLLPAPGRRLRLLSAAVVALCLLGCGQKGPLTLPSAAGSASAAAAAK